MPLTSGDRLGPYEVKSAIGAGGMGEVYRARDTRLDRVVAIKVLPEALSRDPERRTRFQREAKAIAALTHPHICALHDVGQHEDVDFLVMELLEGETLADRLARGPLPIPQALAVAGQIADALANAHRHGIVHRDLKPGNVMLTRSGAKLLDFGLAKLRAHPEPLEGRTETAPITGKGQILGTLNYMAPEQLEGKAVDRRCDVFAFGAILYEMITGKRAFDGSGQASVIGHILHTDPPPITQAVPDAPPALARLVSTCLAKDADDRWSSMHDVLLQLKGLPAGGEPVPSPVKPAGSRARLAWAAAVLTALAAMGLGTWYLATRDSSSTPAALDVVSVLQPADTIQPFADAAQISPDGRHVAFIATDRNGDTWLYVRSFDSETARALPDTEDASQPFWAPDSQRLGFFANGQLKTISIAGGSARTIARAPVPRGGTWSHDDVIVFVAIPGGYPLRVPAAGGEPVAVPAPGPEGATDTRWFPSFLPDDRHYLFFSRRMPDLTFRVSVGSIDSTETRDLVEASAGGVYAPPGYLLFQREGALMAQPFDAGTRQVSGTAVTIAERVGFNAITYQGLYSASTTGRLAYQVSAMGSELGWFDRNGNRLGTVAAEREYNSVCLTSDEKRIVYELATARTSDVDLWTQDLAGGPPTRLTFDPATDFYPVCSPTSQEVIFATLREGRPNLFRLALDAPGSERPVIRSPAVKLATDWSNDGRFLVFGLLDPKTNWDVMVMSLPEGAPSPFAATAADESNGRLSPDGRWMAYLSNESGAREVFVQPFPATGVKWQVSRGGGSQVQWRRDGREIYYVTPDKTLMAVEVKPAGTNFAWGAPQALMQTRMTGWERSGAACCQYAVSRDGQRFLISTATNAAIPITVSLNWTAALRR
jgi:Tol biopolymer transport system component